jgi:hypothetical protein
MTSAPDIQRMPLKLAATIMGMPMESANHKTKCGILRLLREAAVLKRLGKGTPDVICASNLGTKHVNKPVDNCKAIFSTKL